MDENLKPKGPENTTEAEGTLSKVSRDTEKAQTDLWRLVERGIFFIVISCLGLIITLSYIENKSEMVRLITDHEKQILELTTEKWSVINKLDAENKATHETTDLSFYLYVGKDSPAIDKLFREVGHLKVFKAAPDAPVRTEKN